VRGRWSFIARRAARLSTVVGTLISLYNRIVERDIPNLLARIILYITRGGLVPRFRVYVVFFWLFPCSENDGPIFQLENILAVFRIHNDRNN